MRSPAPAALPVLRSRLVGELIALLAADPSRWWTIDELASRTGGAYTTATRELRRLEQARIIETEQVGRSKRIRFDTTNPLHEPLAELMLRAFGPVAVVAEEFSAIDGATQVSIFGSWAARYSGKHGPPANDIDVLVLGEPDRDEVHAAARRVETRLGLPVETVIRRIEDWTGAGDAFARSVKESPMVTVATGPESD